MKKGFEEWDYLTIEDYTEIVTDYVANGSFASLKENVKIAKEEDYALMVKTADFANGFSKGLTYTDIHGYEYLAKSKLYGGELLLSNIGSVGKVFRVPYFNRPMTLASNSIMLRCKNELDYQWAYYFFLSPIGRQKLEQICTGTTMKKFNKTGLRAVELPICSDDKRKGIICKIEEMLSALDNAVETLNKTKKQLATYRQAVLKDAFEGKWNYNNRTEAKLIDDMKAIPLNNGEVDLPKEWKYVYLSSLGDLSRGKSKHRPRNDSRLFEGGKYPFFQTGDVKSARRELVDCEKMYGEFGLQQSKLWPAGTLCITIAANIAETCFLGVDGCFPDSIVGFTPDEDKVNKEYVRYFIEASKLRLWAFAPATAQKNINLTTLENLMIPYCSLDEQKFIVDMIDSRLSECDAIDETVDMALKQSESMRQSILKEAFEGRLV